MRQIVFIFPEIPEFKVAWRLYVIVKLFTLDKEKGSLDYL